MMIVTEPSTPVAPRAVGVAAGRSTGRADQPSGDQRLQLVLSVVLIAASWTFERPLGFTGLNGVVVALLAANSLFLLGRYLPRGSVPEIAELPLICCWTVAAAILLALRSEGFAASFAYFVAGHAGYRLRPRPALTIATAVGVLSAVGLRVTAAQHVHGWPWLLGLTVGLPVFIGMANRSRDLAVASALDAARSAQRAAESEAREQALAERARISRDIHDVLAHSLSGVSMQLELSEMLLEDGDSAGARDAIGKAHSMVREGMAEARRAVTTLRAETLPLEGTLRSQFWGSGEVEVVGTPQELPVEAGQTLIRAAQEALTNARRHAVGARLDVRLHYREADVRLEVANGPAAGGRSAAAPHSTGSGMGLVGMRERASLLGGHVEAGPIVAGPQAGGWQVTVTLPIGHAPRRPPAGR